MSALQAILERRTIAIGVFLITAIAVAGILLDFLPILLFPLGIVALLLLVYNLEWPFVLLFFLLPLSWEQEFENGFFSPFLAIFCLHNAKCPCIFLPLATVAASVITNFEILNMCTSKKDKHYF